MIRPRGVPPPARQCSLYVLSVSGASKQAPRTKNIPIRVPSRFMLARRAGGAIAVAEFDGPLKDVGVCGVVRARRLRARDPDDVTEFGEE